MVTWKESTNEEVHFEPVRHLSHNDPSLTVRFPGKLVESIVEPIAQITSRPSPRLAFKLVDIDLIDRTAVVCSAR